MKDAARVTQIVRDVKLMLPAHEPRAAAMNDRVAEGEAIRTGNLSRSELTFADLSIIRLGANTIFSFNRGQRFGAHERLDAAPGAVLVRPAEYPHRSGDGGYYRHHDHL